MKRTTSNPAAVAVLLAGIAGADAGGLSPDSLRVHGANTVRYSQYETTGLASASPYPFEGDMYFDEFNVYFESEGGGYDRWRGEVSGVANIDDRYRSTHNGLVPERINLTRENGESAIPYRAELGDYFGYFSYLTLQRSLKGLQIELQPQSRVENRQYSLVLTAGAEEASWRNLTLQDNFTTGLSMLVQDALWGALSFNVVHNYRDNSHRLGTLDRSQAVLSFAAEKDFMLAGQRLLFETELAYFTGDHDGTTTARSGQDRSENGYYLQLSGRSQRLPWDYRIRYEQYGQDFRPNGAVVTPDRRSVELHSGWRFGSGLRLRGRAQLFEDGYETTNTTRTRTYGANLSGPVAQPWLTGLTIRADAFVQIADDDARTLSRHTKNLDVSVSSALPGGWTGRLGLFAQNRDDQLSTRGDLFTRQLSFNADHAFRVAGFDGVVTPGMLVRTLRRGTGFSTDYAPSLSVVARRDRHALRFNYGSLLQSRKLVASGPDVDTHTLNAEYRYTRGPHELGVEGSFFDREQGPGAGTDAWRISAFWTWSFDRPPAVLARTAAPVADTAYVSDALDLLTLPLGSDEALVRRSIERAALGGGTDIGGGITVYEFPVLDNIFQRQRLAVMLDAGRLEGVAVVVDLDDTGERDTVSQTFERIRQHLIRRFGPPVRTIEQGEITAALVADVNAQKLIRVIEWNTGSGVLRFGIPRRRDGQVRIEIRHAASLPQPRETLWSVEALR